MNKLDFQNIPDEKKRNLVEDDKLEIESDDVQNALNKIPWLVRRGSSVLTLIVATIFVCCGFLFTYPDIITSPVLLYTNNQPVKVASSTNGNVQSLHAEHGRIVAKGEVLGVVNSEMDKTKISLRAPIGGKVIFLKTLKEQHYVMKGDNIIMIVPTELDRVNAKIKVNAEDVDKILINQVIHIQIDNFYSKELSKLEGKIESFSLHPQIDKEEVFYIADIFLSKKRNKTYDSILSFNNTTHGTAMIVTRRLSLVQRLINRLSGHKKKKIL